MVARPGQYQASFNSGELSPSVWGRFDIKQFYSGAALMVNAEPVPQGGFAGFPGTRQAGRVRGTLAALALSDTGGSLGPHVAAATLQSWVFDDAFLEAVDIGGLSATRAIDGLLRIETALGGGPWLPFGAPFSAGTTSRTRRIAVPPGHGVRADRARLRLFATPPGSVTFTLGSRFMYREAEVMPAAWRLLSHSFSVEQSFTVVLTPGHADIWKGDDFVAAVSVPVTADMLPTLNCEQRLDTMLLFHPDLRPYRIMRRGGDTDWAGDPVPFVNAPLVDYGGNYGNVVNDIWVITITYSGNPAGLVLDCNVNGEDAAGVPLNSGPDWGGFATALKASLEALPSVGTGLTVTPNAVDATRHTLTIVFGGANAGQRFALTPVINNVSTAAAVANYTASGDPGGEAIMSNQRGWPNAGGFFQDRLYLAGFRSQVGAVCGSVTGEYFDLDSAVENAAGGLFFRLDTAGAERIEFLARFKHLLFFSDEAEYFVTDRAIARGTPPNIVQASRNGIAAGIRPVESEGGVLYVGRARSIVYAATYSDVSQSYESEPVSLLASHLVRGVVRADLQRASQSTDAARYFAVRDDGLLLVGVMIRNQEVTAFCRFVTAGQVRDVCVDGANVAYLLVERQVGKRRMLIRERLTDDAVMHQERVFSFEEKRDRIEGLDDFEGVEVFVLADGYAGGPFTVAGGAIDLPDAAFTVIVGRWTAPLVKTLPVPRLVGERTVLQRPVRVHTVRAALIGTTSIAIGANGRPARDIALLRGGDISDRPIEPVERAVEATGLMGWSEDGAVAITQIRPGRLRVRSLTIEARV
ncbi:hypothetical protein [Bosea sp. (in: a-proteobacteria)]|uniref:hypothetical protein n=1 Tax=Bosea sp. (in: a-proteobacteria) TaxID=1871050 RepID=UPI0026266683|nr:hypothetical protein [Bosea sp. (in: a-proteobacteria)]MCO5091995.1 hypothetical protein [Bosea sp. (in: a-proteobacteria)]